MYSYDPALDDLLPFGITLGSSMCSVAFRGSCTRVGKTTNLSLACSIKPG